MKWVDNAKGIAMFSVILGHCLEYINSDMGCSLLLLPIVYSFSVPLFFMVSGYFHKSENVGFWKYVLKKAKSILIPYATFMVICLLVSAIRIYVFKTELETTLFQEFLNIVIQRHYNMLWFLAVLFLTEIISYFLLYKKNYILIFVAIAVSVLTAFLLRRYNLLYLPWSIDIVPFAFIFYAVGFAVRDSEEKVFFKWLSPIYLTVGVALTLINLKITPGLRYVNMYKSDYGFLPLYFLGGIAMSFGILCICKWIEKGRLLSYIYRKKQSAFLRIPSVRPDLSYAFYQKDFHRLISRISRNGGRNVDYYNRCRQYCAACYKQHSALCSFRKAV